MTTTAPQTFSPNVDVFVPRGVSFKAQVDTASASFTPNASSSASFVPTQRMDNFGDYDRAVGSNY